MYPIPIEKAVRIGYGEKEGEKLAPTSPKRAQKIMGVNFFGTEEIKECFGIPAKETEVPFCEETLLNCRNSHILVLGVPLGIKDISEMFPDIFQDNILLSEEDFFLKKIKVGWYLIKTPNNFNNRRESFQQSEARLSGTQYIGKAAIYVYVMVLGLKLQRTRIFTSRVWCQDIDEGKQVYIGRDNEGKIIISSWYNIFCPPLLIGIAPIQKPEIQDDQL